MKYATVVYSHRKIKSSEIYDYNIEDSFLERKKGVEYVILRTCNRIELYIGADEAEKEAQSILEELCAYNPRYSKGEIYTGKEAIKHAFYVAAGLDSIVIGENEVLGQVKSAYIEYLRAKKAGARLEKLFNNAIRTGKKVRAETNINAGKTGIYSLAIDYIQKNYENDEIAVVGSGEEAERFLNGFSTKRKVKGKVFSRDPDHAKRLATKYGMDYGVFDPGQVESYKTVFCAYKSNQKFVAENPKLIVDISIPSVFEGKNVIHIEELASKVKETLYKRNAQIEAAEEIVLSKIEDFVNRYGV